MITEFYVLLFFRECSFLRLVSKISFTLREQFHTPKVPAISLFLVLGAFISSGGSSEGEDAS